MDDRLVGTVIEKMSYCIVFKMIRKYVAQHNHFPYVLPKKRNFETKVKNTHDRQFAIAFRCVLCNHERNRRHSLAFSHNQLLAVFGIFV